MSDYNLGQLIGIVMMVAIAAAAIRDAVKRRQDRTEF